jgi:hypothetical protein
MKKALKFLSWTIVGILALVLVLVLTIPLWLGPTVTTVANKVAPDYTGTSFSLDGVSVNPYTGKYRITKLNLGNPKDYPVPTAFSVSNVLVDVEMTSLFTDTIHIREITIDNPYASYVSKDGTNNFEWIAAHAKEKCGLKEEKEEEKEEEKTAGKKVVIDKLTIAGTRVKLKLLPEMPIPTITLTDIGKDQGGTTWDDVGKMLSDAFMKSTSAIGEGLSSALGVLGDGANAFVGGATNLLDNATGVLGGATTNVLGGASDVIDGASKAVGDTVKKIGNLGGLLGDKDDVKSSETNKPAGKGVIETGKSTGNSVIETGKSAGKGVLDMGKAAGQGVLDAGKSVGEGLKKLNPFGK